MNERVFEVRAHRPMTSTPGVANEVPLEIWLIIIQFLPPKEVSRLYSVNRSLFEICMDVKYRHLHFEGAIEDILALQNPIVARRVESVSVNLLNFQPLLQLLSPEATQALTEAYGRRWWSLFSVEMPQLPSLQSLSIRFYSILNYTQFASIPSSISIQPAWSCVPRSLLHLRLAIPLEAYQDGVIVPRALHFPSLEVLDLRIWAGYRTTDYESILSKLIAPLVNRHSSSLSSLTVKFEEHDHIFYKSPGLFDHLGRLPHLRTFGVRVTLGSPSQTDLSGLSRFISMHADTMKDMCLHLPHSSQFRSMAPFADPTPFHDLATPQFPTFDGDSLFALPLFNPSEASPFPQLESFELEMFFPDKTRFPAERFLSWPQSITRLKLALGNLQLRLDSAGSSTIEVFKQILSPNVFPSLTYLSLYVHEVNDATLLFQLSQLALFVEELELIFSSLNLWGAELRKLKEMGERLRLEIEESQSCLLEIALRDTLWDARARPMMALSQRSGGHIPNSLH
ncbi:hypothetical protein CC1G_07619 [Coprinopsis cinerea okayama7|uniref:F-box domain-containing protein n=1 Tax=Coprinopsis cinerea (strain Okayama-7 / 130 / ATCC MYA-4618 / FGSC 9003) TaxID=240176 RepID=A8NC15_COPC7|nr:hypothetical protein CC1G_07619 [Coprinopsis cinerea okayama7\|eukprot:XP_001832359.2 hypothetical protein CC1G_07619 [Coprinopsis cinerea okayama7\